ncbi:cytochrome P450 [Aminobacter ciceronei]|uniref:Cytochrome P450 n=1 Tax=Aminobacter ciceronei TaxID=150723 RepID=A0ABR6CF84_9HYPH|nr:cytochrome P450 [Aminobacter ciceronei]MBA8909935.1 cytochrome P450 [Aminobacter ciceronei]MBA9023707.1 cytochrome P450 [Aminobacter ciceronei]
MIAFSELPILNLRGKEFRENPNELHDRALSTGRIHRGKHGAEVVSYKLAQELMRDKRLRTNQVSFMNDMGIQGTLTYEFRCRMLVGQGFTQDRTTIRQVFVRHLGPSRAEEMRQTIRVICNDILDGLVAEGKTRGIEFYDDLAVLIPSRLYCHWVGAPKEDAPFVARISDQVLRVFTRDTSFMPSIESGYHELFDYIDAQIADARRNPQDNLLGALIAETDKDVWTEGHLRDFAAMILEASTDNTANQIAMVAAMVLSRPHVWEAVKADPELVPAAVKESIRLHSRSVRATRETLEPIEVDGISIPAGTPVSMVIWAAHRDPTVFPNPDEFDLHRERAPNIQTYGGGVFSCLGQFVAEIEMEEMLRALVERFPNTQMETLETEHDPFVSRVATMKVNLLP